MVLLAGGRAALMDQAQSALESGNAQWAAQLVDHLLVLDMTNERARLLKANALEALSDMVLTATARNYYQSAAMKLRRTAERKMPETGGN